MRFVHLYLIGYFVLVFGALAATGLGIMLAISAGKPEITRE